MIFCAGVMTGVFCGPGRESSTSRSTRMPCRGGDVDPITEAQIKKMNAGARADAQDAFGYFIAGSDPDGKVTYYNLAMAESVVIQSPDRCDVVFPSGQRAEFTTAKAVSAIRRLIDRAR
jgi:hypothetical protein